jgi:hypothetical protein
MGWDLCNLHLISQFRHNLVRAKPYDISSPLLSSRPRPSPSVPHGSSSIVGPSVRDHRHIVISSYHRFWSRRSPTHNLVMERYEHLKFVGGLFVGWFSAHFLLSDLHQAIMENLLFLCGIHMSWIIVDFHFHFYFHSGQKLFGFTNGTSGRCM